MRGTVPRITGFGVLVLVASILCFGDSAMSAKRDKALQEINACLRRNEVSSRECRHLNQDVETLVEVYKGGDRSVLPTLFRFTYLTDFYDEALLSDPDRFLTAAVQLPKKEQQAVADGIAGGTFGLRNHERFKDLRALLTRVPESSANKAFAEMSLKMLEEKNASFFLNYFPPETFTSRAADFEVAWYSRDLYRLGQQPLWPPASDSERVYRFTYLGAFSGPKAVILTVLPDGTGEIRMKTVRESPDEGKSELPSTVSQGQASEFLRQVDKAHFWEMPTESQYRGLDGAEWILEGVPEGKYHIVVRWCPDLYKHSPQDAAFAEAARFLFQLTGLKQTGC